MYVLVVLVAVPSEGCTVRRSYKSSRTVREPVREQFATSRSLAQHTSGTTVSRTMRTVREPVRKVRISHGINIRYLFIPVISLLYLSPVPAFSALKRARTVPALHDPTIDATQVCIKLPARWYCYQKP